jgi:mono/diheme cytochrome c family protein
MGLAFPFTFGGWRPKKLHGLCSLLRFRNTELSLVCGTAAISSPDYQQKSASKKRVTFRTHSGHGRVSITSIPICFREEIMKLVIYLLTCLLTFPFAVMAEVVVREEALTWEKSARLPGDQLYGNLCAACHDSDGMGNGVASSALGIGAPDLTRYSAHSNGVFPRKKVERLIASNALHEGQGTGAMPEWEQQFLYVRTGLSAFQREAHARNRIRVLADYIETLQVAD